MITVVAGTDSGCSGLKNSCNGKKVHIKSSIGEYRELLLERAMKQRDYIVEYQGQKFYISDVAEDESEYGARMMNSNKIHFDTLLLSLIGLHQSVEDGAKVFVVTGLPISLRTPEQKEMYKKLLLGNHTITVNGVKKTFEIVRVEVTGEGAAYGYYIKRNGFYHILDCGSRTVNFVTCKNGGWIDRLSGTFDFGLETQRNESVMLFARKVAASFNQYVRTPMGSIILIGGRAEEIARYLSGFLPNVEVAQDPMFANAIAYEQLGVDLLETTVRQ